MEKEQLDIERLKLQINSMRNDVNNGNIDMEFLHVKYEYMLINTPTVFYLIKDNPGKSDYLPILNHMIDSVKEVQMGETKPEDKDIEIGEFLAEKYLYPVTGKPSQ